MLNILSILGPSRSGKGAIIPLIAAVENFELPFNTPDLDWYIDAYHGGDMTAEAVTRLSVNYLLCYSWYGHLGRHINLRPDDYYSMQKMMSHIDLKAKHSKLDKDQEFNRFMAANEKESIWNIFQWELPPEVYEIIENSYPIRSNPLFTYRAPFYLFTSWISSNRVKRSNSLSRMFKYPSTKNLRREKLSKQFADTRNKNEISYVNGKCVYHEYDFESVSVDQFEEETLLKLINENKEYAAYWSEKGMLYRYEDIVTDPDKFVDYLKNRFHLVFDEELLAKGIELMDKRPMEEVIELDIKKVEKTLETLECTDATKQFIIDEQIEYIKGL
jgi:hypothetical protein